ncbi:YitT family protein [Terrisporobacter glycolicus]
MFLIPNRIIDGGITGISIILSFLTKKHFFCRASNTINQFNDLYDSWNIV